MRAHAVLLLFSLAACGGATAPRTLVSEPPPTPRRPGPSLRVLHRTPLLERERTQVRFSETEDGRVALAWTERGSVAVAVVGADDQLIARRWLSPSSEIEQLDVALVSDRVFLRMDGVLHAFQIAAPELRSLRSHPIPELPVRPSDSVIGGWGLRWHQAPDTRPSDMVVVDGRLTLVVPRAIEGSPHRDICVLAFDLDFTDARADCLEVRHRGFVWLAAEGRHVIVRFGNGGQKSEARIDLAYGSVDVRDLGEAESWRPRSFDEGRIARARVSAGAFDTSRGILGLAVIGARAFVVSQEAGFRIWLWELDEEARIVSAEPLPIEPADADSVQILRLDERPYLVLASESSTRVCSAEGDCTVLARTRLRSFATVGAELAGCGPDQCATWSIGGTPRVHPIPSQGRWLGVLRIGRCAERWLVSLAPAEGSRTFPIVPIDDPTETFAEIEMLDDLVIVGDQTFALANPTVDLCRPGSAALGGGGYFAAVFVGSDGLAIYSEQWLMWDDHMPVRVPQVEQPQFDVRGRLWGLDRYSDVVVLGSSEVPPSLDDARRRDRRPRIFEHRIEGSP